jgi:hypothetical protein
MRIKLIICDGCELGSEGVDRLGFLGHGNWWKLLWRGPILIEISEETTTTSK